MTQNQLIGLSMAFFGYMNHWMAVDRCKLSVAPGGSDSLSTPNHNVTEAIDDLS